MASLRCEMRLELLEVLSSLIVCVAGFLVSVSLITKDEAQLAARMPKVRGA